MRTPARLTRGRVAPVATALSSLVTVVSLGLALSGCGGSGGAIYNASSVGLPTPASTDTASTGAPTDTAAPPVSYADGAQLLPVRVVQANIKNGMSLPKTRADVHTVLANDPDLVSYNEVYDRTDAVLAPAGYSMFRTPGRYTGETAVAWNSSRWTAVATGTRMLSDNRKVQRTQTHPWGVRYATWATLRSTQTGQVLSMVSAHTAPKTKSDPNLLVPSVRRLGELVDQLGQSGPVIVAGDLNVSYTSARYPRTQLAGYDLTSTYDTLGARVATGDYGGNSIDYVLTGGPTQFVVDDQSSEALYSDHRALVADLQVVPNGLELPTFTPTTVTTAPPASRVQRLQTRSLLAQAIAATPAGAAIHVASLRIRGYGLVPALTKAAARGVHVTVITGEATPPAPQQQLAAALGQKAGASSFFVSRPEAWQQDPSLPRSMVLISRAGATSALAMSGNASLAQVTLRPTYASPTATTVTTDKDHYDTLYSTYLGMVDRHM